ncbi:hypothetical protein ZOSMA_375G00130 [Zostera marina]|uniref:Uncharacterized protein n=1 Tax=Zostera marina TaxID=29655 RepID=A0A0K9P5P3_ZOSMR|nr:hypothetical protein ZOSMA_375G00130 [Zostera marina]
MTKSHCFSVTNEVAREGIERDLSKIAELMPVLTEESVGEPQGTETVQEENQAGRREKSKRVRKAPTWATDYER